MLLLYEKDTLRALRVQKNPIPFSWSISIFNPPFDCSISVLFNSNIPSHNYILGPSPIKSLRTALVAGDEEKALAIYTTGERMDSISCIIIE